MSYDFGRFETDIQVLAADLMDTEAGTFVNASQHNLALGIAEVINGNRDVIREDFIDVDETFAEKAREKANAALQHQPPRHGRTTVAGINVIATELESDVDRRRVIGVWLADIMPKRNSTLVTPQTVYGSLRNHNELVFYFDDADEAEAMMEASAAAADLLRPVEVKKPKNDMLWTVADGLFEILRSAADAGEELSKADIYRASGFRGLLPNAATASDQAVRQTFYDAWEIITATFADHDSDYSLFRTSGETAGRRYILNEPEAAKSIWGTADNTRTGLEEAELAQTYKGMIVGIRGTEVIFAKGSVKLENDIQRLAAHKLGAMNKATFIGSKQLVREIAGELGISRSEVELDVQIFLSAMGSRYVERHYNREKNRLMLRLNPATRR